MAPQTDIETRLRAGVAVITGAGSGLGRALAQELARQGVTVAALGRRMSPLEETAGADTAGRIHPIQADVADPDAVAAAFAAIRADLGAPGILINNAAVYPHRDILDETPQSFAQTMDINFGGIVACCHGALQDMVAQGYGRIINVGSFADLHPAPVSAAYSVSKGAGRIFTRALIADLGDRFPDIVINDWMPGVLNTQMGLADGLDPQIPARWGAALALWHARDLSGVVFERDTEILPPLSGKRRIFNKLTGRVVHPRKVPTNGG